MHGILRPVHKLLHAVIFMYFNGREARTLHVTGIFGPAQELLPVDIFTSFNGREASTLQLIGHVLARAQLKGDRSIH